MIFELIAHISIQTQVMEKIIALKHAVIGNHPVVLFRHERLQDRGCHIRVIVAAKRIAEKGGYDAIIAIGAVIRGGTPHFDFVAGECNKGLAQVAMEFTLPVAFGVITTDSIEQSIERAGTKMGNKGAEAALSALEMVNVLDKL